MTSQIQHKLAAIITEIETHRSANQTRLTVLKKWFERPERAAQFGLWVGIQALGRGERATEEATDYYSAARALLMDAWPSLAGPDRVAARALRQRLRDFQNQYRRHQWGVVRLIDDWGLVLIERGLDLYLDLSHDPSSAYRLAADYCTHYDPSHGTNLNGPSRDRVRELLEFVAGIETHEQQGCLGT